jgi:hypothetical protein
MFPRLDSSINLLNWIWFLSMMKHGLTAQRELRMPHDLGFLLSICLMDPANGGIPGIGRERHPSCRPYCQQKLPAWDILKPACWILGEMEESALLLGRRVLTGSWESGPGIRGNPLF